MSTKTYWFFDPETNTIKREEEALTCLLMGAAEDYNEYLEDSTITQKDLSFLEFLCLTIENLENRIKQLEGEKQK